MKICLDRLYGYFKGRAKCFYGCEAWKPIWDNPYKSPACATCQLPGIRPECIDRMDVDILQQSQLFTGPWWCLFYGRTGGRSTDTEVATLPRVISTARMGFSVYVIIFHYVDNNVERIYCILFEENIYYIRL